jgi:hypothetical protein
MMQNRTMQTPHRRIIKQIHEVGEKIIKIHLEEHNKHPAEVSAVVTIF